MFSIIVDHPASEEGKAQPRQDRYRHSRGKISAHWIAMDNSSQLLQKAGQCNIKISAGNRRMHSHAFLMVVGRLIRLGV